MTYIDYMNQFWRVASVYSFPASEVALYALLVYICETLRMSKQTVMTARKHLAEKGLIKFSNGKSRFLPSEYFLLELTANMTHDLTLNNKDKDKEHFKPQTPNSYYDSSTIKNRRRAVEVHTASAKDYETTF